jgi:chemotaxis methyl-accepting protein methylase
MKAGNLPLPAAAPAPPATGTAASGRRSLGIASPRPAATLEDGQYRIWAEHFEQRTGILIHDHRELFVRRELQRRLGELDLDFETYLRHLLQPASGAGEWRHLLDRLLIKETRFFRHRESHDFIREQVAQRASRRSGESLDIWSLGCSTGEEAYSLALDALAGFEAAGRAPEFAVIGTDVSATALREARAGTYPLHALGTSDRQRLARFMEPVGTGRFRLTAAVRRHVGFVADNLLDQRCGFFREGADLIFCQHLLVYFRRWRRRQALNFLARRLKPGGLLVVGPGECSDWQPELLVRERHPDVSAYRRPNPEGE